MLFIGYEYWRFYTEKENQKGLRKKLQMDYEAYKNLVSNTERWNKTFGEGTNKVGNIWGGDRKDQKT